MLLCPDSLHHTQIHPISCCQSAMPPPTFLSARQPSLDSLTPIPGAPVEAWDGRVADGRSKC
ncbi:hypothetical protein E2C01_070406 [Portunus trituberculatus]|uniref:Uncharacterized protein n=1 Tax=Portunus trituberculatus TaxID=210409 RepID=A0A5B7I1H7_PORTR|nr:hypothetical protein [Portunus trituberculatus]